MYKASDYITTYHLKSSSVIIDLMEISAKQAFTFECLFALYLFFCFAVRSGNPFHVKLITSKAQKIA